MSIVWPFPEDGSVSEQDREETIVALEEALQYLEIDNYENDGCKVSSEPTLSVWSKGFSFARIGLYEALLAGRRWCLDGEPGAEEKRLLLLYEALIVAYDDWKKRVSISADDRDETRTAAAEWLKYSLAHVADTQRLEKALKLIKTEAPELWDKAVAIVKSA